MLNKIILELNSYYKEHKGKSIDKKDVIKRLLDKNLIIKHARSLYQVVGTDILLRFSFSRKYSKSLSNTILGFKHIINNNDYFLLSLVLFPETFDVSSMNLVFINKVSSTSVKLTEDNIVGSINHSDIKKEVNGVINDLEHIEDVYELYLKTRNKAETYIKQIIENTQQIKGKVKNKVIITNNDIDEIIIAQKNLSINKLENFIKRKYLNKYDDEIKSIFNLDLSSQQRGTLVEELICGKDTKNNFEDLLIKNKDFNIFINIKTSDIRNGTKTSPYGFNLNKLIDAYIKTKKQKKKFIFVFLFITNTDNGVTYHLYNFLSENLIDYYGIEERWAGRGENSKPGVQFQKIDDKLLSQSSKINEYKARQFLEILK